jgi:hypothetical protein
MNWSKNRKTQKLLPPEQRQTLDLQGAEHQAIDELARKLHAERFPEEYDFVYDSIQDAEDRKRAVNPMNADYIAQIEVKRRSQGVSPLSASGMATSNDTLEVCRQEAKAFIDGLRTRIDEILFYKWDPLQLSDGNWERDEYAAYVPEVLRLALASESYEPIADHLTQIATELMATPENKPHDTDVAKLIFSLTQDGFYHPVYKVIEL